MGFKNNDRCLEKVGEDEPIFVLRAQDKTMIDTIVAWLRLNPRLPLRRYVEANEFIEVINEWQLKHPQRVKSPD